MKKVLLVLVFILLAALIVAIPAFADPPAESGPIVVRFEDTFAVHYIDEARGLGAIVGADIVEFCSGVVDFDLVSIQDIDVPEDANRIVEIIHGDEVTTSVWPFTDFDCALFTSVDPIATGNTNLVSTDNDLFVYENPDNVNWNAFGFNANGQLNTPEGDSVRFNGVSRCVWDGVDNDLFDEVAKCVYRIHVVDPGP